MTKVRQDECSTCEFCRIDLTGVVHEHDHFPVPRSEGGVAVVPACMACHDLKDRVPLDDWSAQLTAEATVELGSFGILVGTCWTVVPECWLLLSREARLLWAKFSRVYQQATTQGLPIPEWMEAI